MFNRVKPRVKSLMPKMMFLPVLCFLLIKCVLSTRDRRDAIAVPSVQEPSTAVYKTFEESLSTIDQQRLANVNGLCMSFRLTFYARQKLNLQNYLKEYFMTNSCILEYGIFRGALAPDNEICKDGDVCEIDDFTYILTKLFAFYDINIYNILKLVKNESSYIRSGGKQHMIGKTSRNQLARVDTLYQLLHVVDEASKSQSMFKITLNKLNDYFDHLIEFKGASPLRFDSKSDLRAFSRSRFDQVSASAFENIIRNSLTRFNLRAMRLLINLARYENVSAAPYLNCFKIRSLVDAHFCLYEGYYDLLNTKQRNAVIGQAFEWDLKNPNFLRI